MDVRDGIMDPHPGQANLTVGTTDPTLPLPERVGRYQVQSLLGSGGTGCVLQALDPVLNRTVAIKLLLPELATLPDAREQFLREARAVACLRDENVVPVYTAEEEGGLVYLVMQHVPGGTLADRLRAPRSLRGLEVLHIARQVTRGLAAAHARGLVHRDIKPSNVLLELDPGHAGVPAPSEGDWYKVKIADFGLVQVAAEGPAGRTLPKGGTPGYMAPEQITGDPVSSRTDLYALGVLLYHMITGRPPFVALRTDELLRKQLAGSPPRPSEVAPGLVSEGLEALILELIQREPAARPATAADVLRRLEALGGEAVLSPEERARLAALRRYRVLDIDQDPTLDDLAALASHVCGTPMALVNLMDEDRQWTKARVGISVQQTARNLTFCHHTIRQRTPMVVPDATQDRRFANNPLVQSDPNIRFYAGVPLLTTDGLALGALCVIDRVPRQLTAEQETALATLSRLVQRHLELRRRLLEIEEPPRPPPVSEVGPTIVPK
jgi:serine/threonine protein kinase